MFFFLIGQNLFSFAKCCRKLVQFSSNSQQLLPGTAYLASIFLFNPETEPKDSTLITPEEPARKAAEAPRASSPAPIKADQILHKELLAEPGLEVKRKVKLWRYHFRFFYQLIVY